MAVRRDDTEAKDALEARERKRLASLHRWHIKMLCQSGFNHHEAELLELAQVNWHDAAALIKRGCSHETAVQILI